MPEQLTDEEEIHALFPVRAVSDVSALTDKELLEMAAKAAGYGVRWVDALTSFNYHGFKINTGAFVHGNIPLERSWDPLTNDGDEARLESTMDLWVSWYPDGVLVGPKGCGPDTDSAFLEYFHQHAGDKQMARRRAGVLAAAAMA